MNSADVVGPAPDTLAPDTLAPDTLASVLAAAVAERGVTLAYLRRRLDALGTPVSLTALSYWRAGHRRPDTEDSLRALGNLERILELAPGTLTDVVGPPRRPSAVTRRSESGRPRSPTETLLAKLDFVGDRGLVDESLQHVLDVDAEGRPLLLRVSCLHRATREGVDRRPIGLSKLHPDGAARPFVALAGGRIGRTVEDLGRGIYAAEFVFDKPLRMGETIAIEYQVTVAPATEQFYELQLLRRLRHAMVWVRFHPQRVPRRVENYRYVGDRIVARPVELGTATSVHHAVNSGGPGRLGIRWSWDDTRPTS